MSQDQQPIKVLSSLVDSNFRVIDPTAVVDVPPGAVVDLASSTAPLANPALESDYITMTNLTSGTPALLNQFIASFNDNGAGIPGDVRDFATKYVKFLVANGKIANNETAIEAAIKTVLDSFALSFQTAISFTNPTESQIIRDLFPNLTTYGNGNTDDPDQMSMLSAMWRDFSNRYVYQPDGSVASSSTTSSQGFFQNLRVFTAVSATITDSHVVVVNGVGGAAVIASSNAFPSYETTFYQYFTGLTPPNALFDQHLQDFARSMIAIHGYFSPSRQYTAFVSYVQNLSNIKAPAIATLPVQDVKILNDIFFLIVKMITSIQNVAASQANRLSLYTSWQKGYTDLLNQVHVFTSTSNDKLRDNFGPFNPGPNLDDVKKRRQDEQGNFNAGLVQQITAFKDTVSEDAKALQSRVNQSSDAFNEQANTATAILQEMSTILSAIFR